MKSSKNLNKEELIDRLLNRGVVDIIDRTHLEEAIRSGKTLRVKFGIDPTSQNIHIGRAIPLRKLRDFQNLGHQVVLIIGDFTAQVGDPSDKISKRPMLTREVIAENLKFYKQQLGKILDLSKIEFVYNSSWLDKLGFQEIATLAENFSISQMLERRNFHDRFERHEEISLREFMYPLMQGYDSVAVRADVELGGNDQLFNLLAGRTIQPSYGQAPQDIMTFGMLEGTDGRKMSSSWGNVISLLDEPSDMFGKVMSIHDNLIEKYFWLTTDFSRSEIDDILNRIKSGEMNPKDAKIILGKEIVSMYYSDEAAEKSADEFARVFTNNQFPSELEEISLGIDAISALDLLVDSGLSESKSEARRLINQGGLKVDGNRVEDSKIMFEIPEEGLTVQAGKHRFVKITR